MRRPRTASRPRSGYASWNPKSGACRADSFTNPPAPSAGGPHPAPRRPSRHWRPWGLPSRPLYRSLQEQASETGVAGKPQLRESGLRADGHRPERPRVDPGNHHQAPGSPSANAGAFTLASEGGRNHRSRDAAVWPEPAHSIRAMPDAMCWFAHSERIAGRPSTRQVSPGPRGLPPAQALRALLPPE